MSKATTFLRDFLEWERANPDLPYGNFPGLVRAIDGVLAENVTLRAALQPFYDYYLAHNHPGFDLMGCNGARLRPEHWIAVGAALAKETK